MPAIDRAVSRPARIVIADDHDLARAGVRAMLEAESDFAVIGEAATGREALELCRRLRPNLVTMDLRMPVMDGLAATRAIKSEMPDIGVIILTMYDGDDLAVAMRSGAAGCILKDSSQRTVVTAVRAVLAGEPLPVPSAQPLAWYVSSEFTAGPDQANPPLSRREREILVLVANGSTNSQIASTLGISRGTVKIHVSHILAKLGVVDRTQAAVRAVHLGLTTFG